VAQIQIGFPAVDPMLSSGCELRSSESVARVFGAKAESSLPGFRLRSDKQWATYTASLLQSAGFPTYSHRDMEIVTYVLEVAPAHKDSTGTSSVVRPVMYSG
jgi:redox-sensitive bicupin YhaK (pirin superfamily)